MEERKFCSSLIPLHLPPLKMFIQFWAIGENFSSGFPESLQTRIKRFLWREDNQIVSRIAPGDDAKCHISSGKLNSVINIWVAWCRQRTFPVGDEEKEDGHLRKYKDRWRLRIPCTLGVSESLWCGFLSFISWSGEECCITLSFVFLEVLWNCLGS